MASCQAAHAATAGRVGPVGDMVDAARVRESARIHVQVLDEGCVFAVSLRAVELLDHDFAHPGGHLFARPLPGGGAGEICFVRYDLASEVAYGR